MPNPLHLCFSKLKLSSSPAPSPSSWASKWSKPRARKFSKSSSQNALLFNSLYNTAASDSALDVSTSNNTSSSSLPSSSTTSTSASESDGPDLSAALSSHRFFVSSPGSSNAIVEEAATRVGPGLAVPTYSPDPYADFRRSMEEMVVAQGLDSVGAHWEQLHELLLCYLALNRKHAHKFIVCAFADLLVSLSPPKSEATSQRRPPVCRKSDPQVN